MSTRWYPLYQRGNPQLRVFLPNFWMKLVKPDPELTQRKNVVQFHVSMEMTKHDIKNYLEKIYKVPVIKVNTRIALGKMKRNELNVIVKDDDIKIAFVHLPRYESFAFPDMFENEIVKEEKKKDESVMDEVKESYKKSIETQQQNRPGIPSWYSL